MTQRHKYKQLYTINIDGITTRIRCVYSIVTHGITFHTEFYKSTNPNRNRDRNRDRTNERTGIITTNKECAIWLGNKAEIILMSMFNHVERMPYGNPGYDFICGLDYKIDAKSSCTAKNKHRWTFRIRQNTTADYFLCLAFDNRKDLNPLHVWMIPGDVVNHLQTVAISKSILSKWSQYEKSLDKVLSCCNTMKDHNL